MDKPRVSEISFWKDRIADAKREQHSVYICNDILWARILEEHTKIIYKLIKETDKVLDAGCGYGRMAELFLPECYLGVDFSPDFIAKAKSKYPIHSFEVGDIKKLPYKNHQFDWAFCISIRDMITNYDDIKNWEKMEKELKRVAKKILILEYVEPQNYEVI